MGVHELGGQLMAVLQQLEQAEEVNKIILGHEALAIIRELLSIDPYDVDALVWRMKLNSGWAFEESGKIIEDAEFIANNDHFGESKMIGYDWLTWVYDDKMGMPNKAIEVIENQLVEVYALFKKQSQRDQREGELLNKMAFIKQDNNETEEALKLWNKSYDKYPYIQDRNAIAGMHFLDRKEFKLATKLLWTHFDWSFTTEDGFRLAYAKKLKKLADNNELEAHPDLIGILYHSIRNEEDTFGLEAKTDFYDNYLPKLEQWAVKYPENSIIWAAIGNTYFLDTKNYEHSLKAYTKMLEGDRPTAFEYLKRIHKSAKKIEADFFSLPFSFEGTSSSLYNHMSQMKTYANKTGKKKKKKKYLKYAIEYGERCYQQFSDYLLEGKGDSANNLPHLFAMSCNNYGLTLGNWNSVMNEEELDLVLAKKAGEVHKVGYEISPFYENLYNGSSTFYDAQEYDECIKGMEEYLVEYKNDTNFFDIQDALWFIQFSYAGKQDFVEVEKTYFRAKEYFEKAGAGSTDATTRFIYIAKKYYMLFIDDLEKHEKVIPEIEWFLNQESFNSLARKEVGLMNYYLGKSYQKVNKMEASVVPLQKCVSELQEEEFGYYYEISEEAAVLLNAMGAKSGHQYEADKPKGTGFFSRLKKKLNS